MHRLQLTSLVGHGIEPCLMQAPACLKRQKRKRMRQQLQARGEYLSWQLYHCTARRRPLQTASGPFSSNLRRSVSRARRLPVQHPCSLAGIRARRDKLLLQPSRLLMLSFMHQSAGPSYFQLALWISRNWLGRPTISAHFHCSIGQLLAKQSFLRCAVRSTHMFVDIFPQRPMAS